MMMMVLRVLFAVVFVVVLMSSSTLAREDGNEQRQFARFVVRSVYGAEDATLLVPLQEDIAQHIQTTYPTLENAGVAVEKPQREVLLVILSNVTRDDAQPLQSDLETGDILIFHQTRDGTSMLFHADAASFVFSSRRDALSADLAETVQDEGGSGYTVGQGVGVFFGSVIGVLLVVALVFVLVHRSNASLVLEKPPKAHGAKQQHQPFSPFQAGNPMRYASVGSVTAVTSKTSLFPSHQQSSSSA
ncbi:hypothetical protein PTSG_02286 [Salpingoeca rosetta]|uniref:Ubiquitin-like domain-containing protein n=1 Tax=Salpingoeca rosetta (strain ATCC 50818 / BSB-021) TaxID=946362 RepID=F2U1R9_SALR5|nr:uncharacterized protein PTSG_02286 [Salpingoeca rosetta]EGD81571.1 hypothetical protein PTSG_02286 [Salpingoeca rosetta]|eukprot:XP_004996775.1 hypothetical protein PTSG_02286 [Salpingoeca rosetta]